MADKTYMAVEDLEVYRKLCQLHLEVCDLAHQWPNLKSRMVLKTSYVHPDGPTETRNPKPGLRNAYFTKP